MTSAKARLRSFVLTMAMTEGLLLIWGSRALVNILYKDANPLAWVVIGFTVLGMFVCVFDPFVKDRDALLAEMEREARDQKPFDVGSEVVSLGSFASFLLMGVFFLHDLPVLYSSAVVPMVAKAIVTGFTLLFVAVCAWGCGDRFLRWRIAVRQKDGQWWKKDF